MKKIFQYIPLLAVTFLCTLNSCKKLNNGGNEAHPIIKKTRNEIVVKNGILAFKDMTSLSNYITEIESILSSNLTVNKYEALSTLESQFTYRSYRSTVDQWKLNPEGFDNPDLLPIARFGSNVLKSILNDKFEIIINDEYYNFNYAGYYIFSKKIDNENIESIRQGVLTNLQPLDCIKQLQKNNIDASLIIESEDFSKKSRGSESFMLPTNNTFQIHGILQVTEACSNNTVTLSNVWAQSSYNITNIPINGMLTIDWGDGNFETRNTQMFVGSSPVASTGTKQTFIHTYSSSGSYQITFTFAQGTTVGSVSEPLPLTGCLLAPTKNKVLWNYPNNGAQYAVKREIWMCNTFLYRRIGSETDSYKQKANGGWKNFKCTSITADVEGDLADKVCLGNQSSNYDTDANDDDAESMKSQGGSYNYIKVKSTHKATFNGTVYVYNDELKACP
jgi:hypothetical protein